MEEALEKYYKHFGENYPLSIVSTMTDEEIINRINQCIKSNRKEEEPEYNDEYDY